MTFGARLRSLRISNGYTLAKLGELSGVPQSQMSLYERDKIYPSSPSLERIASVLGVSMDYLFGRTSDKTVRDYSDLLQQLPEDRQSMVFEFLIEQYTQFKMDETKTALSERFTHRAKSSH